MSLITTLEHAYAATITDLRKAGVFIEHSILPALQAVHAEAPIIEAVTATVSPQLANIERTADAALGALIKAVQDGGAAVAGGGLNVTLDAQLVNDIKAIAPIVVAASNPALVSTAPKPAPAAA